VLLADEINLGTRHDSANGLISNRPHGTAAARRGAGRGAVLVIKPKRFSIFDSALTPHKDYSKQHLLYCH